MIDTSKLYKNIEDVVYESQVKLGYEKRKVVFYYPLEALNNLLCADYNEKQMQEFLELYFVQQNNRNYGVDFIVTHKKEQFCIEVSEQFVEKVHLEY